MQRQTVAEHTWNVVRILLTVWPGVPAGALAFAQFHDVAEVGTGDVPYPVKHNNPVLAAEMDRLEAQVIEDMGLTSYLSVSIEWQRRIKMCDVIEMWEFGLEERHLGNRYADPIVERMEHFAIALASEYGLEKTEQEDVIGYMRNRRERYK